VTATRLLALVTILIACAGAGWVDLNEAGKKAYARGDYAGAEHLFRQAVAAAPAEAEVHYHHAVALTHLHRYADAMAAYERALSLGPSAAVAAAARHGLRSVEPLTRLRAAPPPAAAAEPPPRRPAPPTADSVALRRHGNNWFADVTLNDDHRSTFLVDTGAAVCAITPPLAEALGLVPDSDEPPVLIRGVTGSTWGRRVTIPSIRVGGTEARDVAAVIVPLPGMQGILGNSFLARYVATLDPARAVLTLQRR